MAIPSILTVCTGNICRSPASEYLLRELLDFDVSSSSAGTHGLNGAHIPTEMLAELAADGIDASGHRGSRLTAEMVRSADLIVAMTSTHRQFIVQLEPRGLRKSYTLAELAACAGTGAELAGGSVAERIANLPIAVSAHRPTLADYNLADVPDPYRGSQSDYHEAYVLIRDSLREVVDWLRG